MSKTNSFGKRLKSMLAVDIRRMLVSPLFYILLGVAFLIPVLVLVMTTMMDGATTTDPGTGAVTTIRAFESVWQIIGSPGGTETGMSMDLTSMCNINLLYFLLAVLVCLFVSEDFRSGYAKNLFTVRAKKTDYVISKTLVCFACGALMVLVFFIGAMLGGGIAGLPFDMGAVSVGNIIMSLLSKAFLMAVFVAIYLAVSVAAKQRTWLSVLGSLGAGMLLFSMVPMITPLDAGVMNLLLCLVGSGLFGVGLGAVSNLILNKTTLV